MMSRLAMTLSLAAAVLARDPVVRAAAVASDRAHLAPELPEAVPAQAADAAGGTDPSQATLLQARAAVRAFVQDVGPKGHDAQEVSAAHTVGASGAVQAPLYAYPTVFGLITCVIVGIYGNRGWKVVLSVMCYLTALSTMKIAVKWVFVEYAFKFPKFVTVTHFVSGGLVCLAVLLKNGPSKEGAPVIAVPTLKEFFLMITPIAMAASISIGANNMALGFSSVAFTEIVAATGCLFTAGTVILMGMPFDLWLLIPCTAVAMGCAVSTAGEVNFSMLGLLLCFASNAFRSAKVTLQQKLMTGESKDKFDPCTLLMWVSVPSTIAMLVGSLMSEGLEPYRVMAAMDSSTLRGLCVAIGVSCVNAVILNLAQLFVTKDLGAVGSSLVAQAKAVLTVLGGMAVFGEPVTKQELFGFAVVLVGVYAFSAMETRSKQRRELEAAKVKQAQLMAQEQSPAEKA